MNLIGYEPWNALNLAHRDLSRLLGLGGFGHKESEHSPAWRKQWSPAVDVREEDDRFVLTVDLPGIDPKAVKITAEKGVLTISGERHLGGKAEGKDYRRVESVYGEFLRQFNLPESADLDGISARGEHGVLEISIAKQAQVQPRRIDVN